MATMTTTIVTTAELLTGLDVPEEQQIRSSLTVELSELVEMELAAVQVN